MDKLLLVIICGMAGGVINCILFGRVFFAPTREIKEGKIAWDLGFINNLLSGVAASIIIYGLGAIEFETNKMIATCLLSGIGGGGFIINMLQQQEIKVKQQESQFQKQAINEKKNEFDIQKEKSDMMEQVMKLMKMMIDKKDKDNKEDEQEKLGKK